MGSIKDIADMANEILKIVNRELNEIGVNRSRSLDVEVAAAYMVCAIAMMHSSDGELIDKLWLRMREAVPSPRSTFVDKDTARSNVRRKKLHAWVVR